MACGRRKFNKPTRLHIFKDETRQETFCGRYRGDNPIIQEDAGPCKICNTLFDAYESK